jgi:hypothetical protein
MPHGFLVPSTGRRDQGWGAPPDVEAVLRDHEGAIAHVTTGGAGQDRGG